MTKFRLVAIALVAVFVLSACNTVRGFGKDVEKAGDQLQEAVDETKN